MFQISLKRLKSLMNVPDFLKKYTSASRKRVTHTEQLKLRDKEKKWNQNVWVDCISQEKISIFKMKTTEKMQNFQERNLSA